MFQRSWYKGVIFKINIEHEDKPSKAEILKNRIKGKVTVTQPTFSQFFATVLYKRLNLIEPIITQSIRQGMSAQR